MKEINFNNSSWPFKLDEICLYAFWEKAFSKEECLNIIDIAKKRGLVRGKTAGEESNDIRDSEVSWLFPNDDMVWAFQHCTDLITDLNKRFFNFDLYGLSEGFQFTNYKAPGGKYGKHIDRGFKTVVRKLSLSIQLTDPSEYEGGELYLYENDERVLMDKKQGTLIVFPSYVLHEVTPVTKGERNSLVSWVTGPPFK
tara:strand:+ start:1627 stop:2217 length:591 start_codon:yes stop_codon:yes gene_type:complete